MLNVRWGLRFVLGLVLGFSIAWGCGAQELIHGGGSSAAHPVYRVWAEEYARNGGRALRYEPSGSSAGLKSARERRSDFGASDIAPSQHDCERDGLVVVPTAITGAVPVVNLPRFSGQRLVLDGDLLAAIFLGQIRKWNDARIQALNPSVRLPDLSIERIVRSDGSGTTFHFSDYLSRVSPDWKRQLGAGAMLNWPSGTLSAIGSQGVVDRLVATPGGIAYVDYNYVVEHALSAVALRVADGSVIEAGPHAFRSALLSSAWLRSGDFTQTLTHQSGKGAWPITMGTFVVLPRVAERAERTGAVIRFLTWAFLHGDNLVGRAHFVRLPDLVQAKAYRALAEVRDPHGAPLSESPLFVKQSSL